MEGKTFVTKQRRRFGGGPRRSFYLMTCQTTLTYRLINRTDRIPHWNVRRTAYRAFFRLICFTIFRACFRSLHIWWLSWPAFDTLSMDSMDAARAVPYKYDLVRAKSMRRTSHSNQIRIASGTVLWMACLWLDTTAPRIYDILGSG